MNNGQYIFAKTLIGPKKDEHNVYVKIKDGYIKSIQKEIDEELPIKKVSILAPGLIDTHIHGNTGYDTMDGEYESINQISKELAKYGVTAFCPTTLTAPMEKIKKALNSVAQAKEKGTEGAEVIGVFIEGPYFTETHKGAHPTEYFKSPTEKEIDELIESAKGHISSIALAPEKEGCLEIIPYIVSKGIKVSIAHTNADYETCEMAIDKGATIGVHTFNGMKGLHHREPGTVGAILTDKRVYGEIIADGEHVHPQMIEMMYQCKTKNKMTLISDAMCATGMNDGQYKLGELEVVVKSGVARTTYGSLAGSTLKLIDAVFNIENWTSAKLRDAITMATLTPARSLAIENEMGQIAINTKANLIAIEDGHLVKTWVKGKIVFQEEE